MANMRIFSALGNIITSKTTHFHKRVNKIADIIYKQAYKAVICLRTSKFSFGTKITQWYPLSYNFKDTS